MPSGPGAEEGEDLERASLVSSSVRGVAEGYPFRGPLLGRGSLGAKRWSRSPLLIATGSEASGREGGSFLGRPVVWPSICCPERSWQGNRPNMRLLLFLWL